MGLVIFPPTLLIKYCIIRHLCWSPKSTQGATRLFMIDLCGLCVGIWETYVDIWEIAAAFWSQQLLPSNRPSLLTTMLGRYYIIGVACLQMSALKVSVTSMGMTVQDRPPEVILS